MNRDTKVVSHIFLSILWLICMWLIPYYWVKVIDFVLVIINVLAALSYLPCEESKQRKIQKIKDEVHYIVFRDRVKKKLTKRFEHEAPIERKGFFD